MFVNRRLKLLYMYSYVNVNDMKKSLNQSNNCGANKEEIWESNMAPRGSSPSTRNPSDRYVGTWCPPPHSDRSLKALYRNASLDSVP